MPYPYGLQNPTGLSALPRAGGRGLRAFPVVGNGLPGLPRRAPAGPPPIPYYREDLGAYGTFYNAGGGPAQELRLYRYTTDFQLTTIGQTIQADSPGSSQVICESANGLHLWTAYFNSGVGFAVRKYSRAAKTDNWSLDASISAGFGIVRNMQVSVDGTYCLLGVNNDSSGLPSAVLWKFTAGAISEVTRWNNNGGSGSAFPIAMLDDIPTGRVYYMIGGYSSTEQPGIAYTRPEIGYIENGVRTVIISDAALYAVVGSLAINCRFGFCNSKVGFFHIDVNSSVIREFSLSPLGVSLVGTVLTSAGSSDNNVDTYPGIQLSPRDDYFIWCGAISGGIARILVGWKAGSGSWNEFNSSSYNSSSTGNAHCSVSPSETRMTYYNGSSTVILPFSYDPTNGVSFGSSIATFSERVGLRFSSGVSTAFKRIRP